MLTEYGDVTRVRLAYVTDDMIRALAAHFPAPVQLPVMVPEATDRTPPHLGRGPPGSLAPPKGRPA